MQRPGKTLQICVKMPFSMKKAPLVRAGLQRYKYLFVYKSEILRDILEVQRTNGVVHQQFLKHQGVFGIFKIGLRAGQCLVRLR
jgi:hypothetical protein